MRDREVMRSWNRHPLNQKAKEMLLQVPPDETDQFGEPFNPPSEATELLTLRLMEWGTMYLDNLHRDARNRLMEQLEILQQYPPKVAMSMIHHEERGPQGEDPYPGKRELEQMTDPASTADVMLDALWERMEAYRINQIPLD